MDPIHDESRREAGFEGGFDRVLSELAGMRRLAAALLRGRAPAEVDDVVQDASLVAMTSDAPRGAAFGPWLRGVVRHLSSTTLRSKERREARGRQSASPTSSPPTDEVAHRIELHRAVLAAVAELSEPYRSTISRRYLDGLKPRAIARADAVPVATVKTRLRRGLELLRARLRKSDIWGGAWLASLVALAKPGVVAGVGVGVGVGASGGAVSFFSTGMTAMSVKAKLAVAAVMLVVAGAIVIPLVRLQDLSGAGELDQAALPAARDPVRDGPPFAESPAIVALAEPLDPAIAAGKTSRPRRERFDPRRLASLRGRVVDEQRAPVSGVEVDLIRSMSDELPNSMAPNAPPLDLEQHRATTDAEGRVDFVELIRGTVFRAGARSPDDRFGVTEELRAGMTGEFEIRLAATTAIRGIVVDAIDEQPIAGARVRIRSSWTGTASRFTASTDEAGRFTLPNWGNGADEIAHHATVVATAPNGRVSLFESFELPPGGSVDLRILAGGPYRLEGVVFDAVDGTPIAGAEILWTAGRYGTKSKADGSFQIVTREQWRGGGPGVTVTAEGYSPVTIRTEPPATTPTYAEVRMHSGRVAIGRLVSTEGEPIAGALVAAVAAQPSPLRSSPPSPGTASPSSYLQAALTSEDGSFRLDDLSPAVGHSLLIRADECERLRTRFPEDEHQHATIDLGEIRVGPGALVAGVVRDDAGATIAHARLTVMRRSAQDVRQSVLSAVDTRATDHRDPQHRELSDRLSAALREFEIDRRQLACDAAGRFVLHGMGPGRWAVTIEVPGGGRPSEHALEIEDGEICEDLVLVVPAGLVIAGRVVDGRGKPLSAEVTLDHARPTGPDGSHTRVAGVGSAEDGTFRFTSLLPGSYRISVAKYWRSVGEPIFLPAKTDPIDAGTTDVTIELADGALIEGVVRDDAGKPFFFRPVLAIDSLGNQLAKGHSSKEGRFMMFVPPDVEVEIQMLGGVSQPFFRSDPNPPIVAREAHVWGGDAPLSFTIPRSSIPTE